MEHSPPPHAISLSVEEDVSQQTQWAAIVALAAGVFALVTSEFLPASVLTPIADDLGVSSGAAGQAVTATAIIGMVSAPLVPILTQRFDRRRVLLGLMLLLGLSNLLSAMAVNLPMLLAGRVLLGASLGGFWSMAAATAMRLSAPGGLPRAMSVVFTGVSLATVLAAPAGAWIGELWGWRAAFMVAGVLGGIAFAAQWATLPQLPPTVAAGLRDLVSVARRPAISVALVSVVLLISGHFAGFTYIRPVLEDVAHLQVGAISAVLLAFGLAGFLGNFVGAALAERDPKLAVIGGGALIAAAAASIVLFGGSAWIAAAAFALWGFAFAALPIGFQSWVTQEGSDKAEIAGGLLTATFQVAIALGAIFGGLLLDGFGPLGAPSYSLLVGLAGLALVLASRRQAPRVADQPCCAAS